MRAAALLLPLTLSAAPLAAAELVPVPAFDSIELRGGGDIVIRRGPAQRVVILNGSTQFTTFQIRNGGQLVINGCNQRCPPHYNLKIEIQSPSAPDVAIQGGGEIVAAPGFAPQGQLSAAISGGGIIDVRSVSASSVSAAVNGGGKILSGRSASLSAAVNGGGEVRYTASGSVSMAVHGGGSVRQGN
jgi:hypothetical protein